MTDLEQLAAIVGAILLGLALVALLTPRHPPRGQWPINEPHSNIDTIRGDQP